MPSDVCCVYSDRLGGKTASLIRRGGLSRPPGDFFYFFYFFQQNTPAPNDNAGLRFPNTTDYL